MHTQTNEKKREKRSRLRILEAGGVLVWAKETKETSMVVEKRRFETRPNNAFQSPSRFQLHPDNFLHYSPHRSLDLLSQALFPRELVALQEQLSLLHVSSSIAIAIVTAVALANANDVDVSAHWKPSAAAKTAEVKRLEVEGIGFGLVISQSCFKCFTLLL